ncbi:hypothetical protein AVEN_74526-1 [Araneus ventricosus]|uniref:Uncharacterized protein n=1 Tax=Araneus ventricosus TaxID=182803 RepID=A0A4Y2GQY8_ARAVE|nr:hypothetical protein AVEN_74526-1 [Araneus ventricosus]
MNWTLPTWVVIYHPLLVPSLKTQGNGLWLARIIRPTTAFMSEANSEPHLLSKETNLLGPAFVAIRRKFLDCRACCERVNRGQMTRETPDLHPSPLNLLKYQI